VQPGEFNRRFGGICRLHLLGQRLDQARHQNDFQHTTRRYIPGNRKHPFITQYWIGKNHCNNPWWLKKKEQFQCWWRGDPNNIAVAIFLVTPPFHGYIYRSRMVKVIPVQAMEDLRVAGGWGSHIFRRSTHRWW
jgi:hypothetical protein